MQTGREHPKQKERTGKCVPAYKQVLNKACLNDQPMKGTLVGQCFMILTREDHQALSKQVNEWTNEQTNERTKERTNERMNEWMNGWMNERLYLRVNDI